MAYTINYSQTATKVLFPLKIVQSPNRLAWIFQEETQQAMAPVIAESFLHLLENFANANPT